MATLELHQLRSTKRARQLAKLIDSMHREGRRIVVWVGDEGRRQILDDYLKTYREHLPQFW